jgi:glycosyltransferase involved in cell wall biosynthesis
MLVLISNGGYKFHLAPLASELNKYGLLKGLITAGWPKRWQTRLLKPFSQSAHVQRYLDRWEPIDEHLVFSSPISEILLKIGDLSRRYSHPTQHRIHIRALHSYASYASKVLKSSNPTLYHYRAGYGGNSINIARSMNLPSICDHSIAHPYTAEFLVDNKGLLPTPDQLKARSHLSRYLAEDINNSDFLMVNSNFVKQTCILAGYPQDRIFVVYLGVDDKYLHTLSNLKLNVTSRNSHSVLYVGGWQRRKGVETLVDALHGLSPKIPIEVAGGIEPELSVSQKHLSFFNQSHVTYHGIVNRNKLSQLFSKHSIFVFPSYCEGSARVIFEAMAAGCYIITTPNSGSIVEDNINGSIVPPGDVNSLRKALLLAIKDPSRVAEIGAYNAKLVRDKFTQDVYMQNVLRVYNKLLSLV